MIFWRRKKKNAEKEKSEEVVKRQAEPQIEAQETPVDEPEPDVVSETTPEPVPEIVPDVAPAPVPVAEPDPLPTAAVEDQPEPTPAPVADEMAPEINVPSELLEAEQAPEAPEIENNLQEAPIEDVVKDVPLESLKEEVQEEPVAEQDKAGWFKRLKTGLAKSSDKIGQGISDLMTKKKLDQDTLDELEELLIMADLGPATAAKLVSEFGEGRFGKEISAEEIKEALAESVSNILKPVAVGFEASQQDDGPFVILVCGVNGVGKTTTIGKLAQKLREDYQANVMMAAGDTFRAAAIEQLHIWAERTGSGIVSKELGSDAAAVAYESYSEAKAKGADVLMIDTAGRLHNKSNLMAELEKIVRVLKKQNEKLPHAVLLVLDATTGQNAHEQVRTFKEMVDVTGLVVTKLDGSARGGVVVGLADAFELPIHYVGVGEQAADLQPFDPDEFARSLMGLS